MLPGGGGILAGPCKQGSRDLLSRKGAEKHKLSLGAASGSVWLEGRVWAGAKEVNGGSRGKALNAQLSSPGRGKPKNTPPRWAMESRLIRPQPHAPLIQGIPKPSLGLNSGQAPSAAAPAPIPTSFPQSVSPFQASRSSGQNRNSPLTGSCTKPPVF